MLTSKLEVLVDLGSSPEQHLLNKTLNELKAQKEIKQADFKDGAFIVETTLPSTVVVDLVSKASGKRAVLQGFGETQSAVAMVSNPNGCTNIMGVVRFQQSTEGPLVVDGMIDGLPSGQHGLHVHETGDLSLGCMSIGAHFNPHKSPHGGPQDSAEARHAGDLGNITADEKGRATFRIVDEVLKVWDIVGRSVAVSERCDDLGRGSSALSKVDGDSGRPLACGIIARSAGIFQNPKRICLCDGVVVWDERDKPLAGRGRRGGETQTEKKRCCLKGDAQAQDTNVKPCCKV